MYIFKNAQNKWIFGDTTESVCPSGIFRLEPSRNLLRVTIKLVSSDKSLYYNEPVTAFKKADGTAYTSFSEFKAATDGFFDAPQAATSMTVTESSSGDILDAADTIAGKDFLAITDTDAHSDLDCTSIYVMDDAVFDTITVAGSNVVAGKGLSELSVVAGTLLPFGKAHASAIKLTSGKIIAYIN